MLKRNSAWGVDICRTPFLRHCNLLRLLLTVGRLKWRLPTSPWSCRPRICHIAMTAACRWGHDAIECHRLPWDWQTQLQPSWLKNYPRCPVSTGWPDLWSTSHVKTIALWVLQWLFWIATISAVLQIFGILSWCMQEVRNCKTKI